MTAKNQTPKSAHTPGPWEVCPDRLPYRIIPKHSNLVVAACDGWAAGYRRTHDEYVANARLISASPDLLTAAKWALAYMEAEDNAEARQQEAALRAAIAKAEGK